VPITLEPDYGSSNHPALLEPGHRRRSSLGNLSINNIGKFVTAQAARIETRIRTTLSRETPDASSSGDGDDKPPRGTPSEGAPALTSDIGDDNVDGDNVNGGRDADEDGGVGDEDDEDDEDNDSSKTKIRFPFRLHRRSSSSSGADAAAASAIKARSERRGSGHKRSGSTASTKSVDNVPPTPPRTLRERLRRTLSNSIDNMESTPSSRGGSPMGSASTLVSPESPLHLASPPTSAPTPLDSPSWEFVPPESWLVRDALSPSLRFNRQRQQLQRA
jgi:hypothetical protein